MDRDLTEENLKKIDEVISEFNKLDIENLSENEKADILNKIFAVQKRIEEKQKEIVNKISLKNKESKYFT